MKIKLKNIINNNGYHKRHKEKTIEYGITNDQYWYYCHKCKEYLNKYNLKITAKNI